MSLDAHHILFNRQEWSLRPDAKWLRTREELIPDIDSDVHKLLHQECPAVPLLGFHALRRVAKSFEIARHDTLASVDNLMQSVEHAGQDRRAHPLEKELCRLAVWAVDLQRPYIRAGTPTDQLYFDLGR